MTDTMRETEIMSKLFLELSQFVPAKTARELQLEAAQADARALVGELLEETLPLYEFADKYYKERGLEVKKQALTKAQAFMEETK